MMKKHAYLIMAHNEFDLLEELLEALDDVRNDIYVHIDAKVKKFPFDKYKEMVTKSKLIFVKKRMNVLWGGDTQIKCELYLLKEAYKKGYVYYHLLSGVDYPVRSQDFIHDFFEKNHGKNYIDFETDEVSYQFAKSRMEYRHYFQNVIGKSSDNYKNILYRLDACMLYLQELMGLSRLRRCNLVIKKGAQWFSITNELVKEILDSKKIIKKLFYHGVCADEMFVMTVAYNSELRETLVNNNLRYILWEGELHPKLLNSSNYQDMMQSACLFARKFSKKHDIEVVHKIKEQCKAV